MTRPIRIGLLAEGDTELGKSVYLYPEDAGKIIKRADEGALHTLIRRELTAAGYHECEFVQRHPSTKNGVEWEDDTVRLRTGHGIIETKYIAQIISVWQPHEIDMVVIVVDTDKKLEQRTKDLAKAMEVVRKNHFDENDQPITDRSTGGLAIKRFETWMLADEQAIEQLLGFELPQLPPNLEELPKNTKTILDKAIDHSKYLQGERPKPRGYKTCWALAFNISLTELKNRCKQGYGRFAVDICATAKTVNAYLSDQ